MTTQPNDSLFTITGDAHLVIPMVNHPPIHQWVVYSINMYKPSASGSFVEFLWHGIATSHIHFLYFRAIFAMAQFLVPSLLAADPQSDPVRATLSNWIDPRKKLDKERAEFAVPWPRVAWVGAGADRPPGKNDSW